MDSSAIHGGFPQLGLVRGPWCCGSQDWVVSQPLSWVWVISAEVEVSCQLWAG